MRWDERKPKGKIFSNLDPVVVVVSVNIESCSKNVGYPTLLSGLCIV